MQGRTLFGSVLLLIGILLLVDRAGWYDTGGLVSTYWPLGLIVLGAIGWWHQKRLRGGQALLILVGGLLLLDNLGRLPASWPRLVWPIILIVFALVLLSGRRRQRGHRTGDHDAWLGSHDQRVTGQLNALSTSALLGNVKLDLRTAHIADGAEIQASAILGSVELFVPNGVRVRVEGTPVAGSIDNQATGSSGALLRVKATVILGSLEIRQG